jgi:hypothetical protein
MCEAVVELMREGASLREVCAGLDINPHTRIEWEAKHPEFSHAIKSGIELSAAWWEKEGRTSLRDKEFSPTLWYMNMRNRFGWADKQEISGPGGGPQEHKWTVEIVEKKEQ